MKEKLEEYRLVVHGYDRRVWEEIKKNPEVVGLIGRKKGRVEGGVSIKESNLVYFVEIEESGKDEIEVKIYYKN